MTGEAAEGRVVVDLSGKDVLPFLQGLVTNDVLPLAKGPGLVWAALLTPQGKYLADFFVGHLPDGRMILDLPAPLADATLKRLTMYRLRADVRMAPTDLQVGRGIDDAPEGALPDPRHPGLGWRLYGNAPGGPETTDWDAIRVAHVIPESGIELLPEDAYILEAGFERLHGVDFRKGCYVGQEVTARMKHKTELRKGLVRVLVEGQAVPGSTVLSGERDVGRLFTTAGGRGIAHLRLDRAEGVMQAGSAVVRLDPDWPEAARG
ncbi:CAF17-like 4Fe-4S cluster assembly/insertion protein YgfZ [Neotabrizicola shimadae]|uniref:Folate-binding protein YgfZ n=1 Tax=Neotabrizicola shimadae TaxID=2807096 RepID=A0A8G0ZY09_9RHOB|nr:folate-binding protein [Neotabrizicola shimadae]QYZ71570.1 folate-binding protein YgfZ [Neotabrizicola shimadae]